MSVFNNFAPPNIEEEAARRQALIDEMWADDEDNENEKDETDEEEKTKNLDL